MFLQIKFIQLLPSQEGSVILHRSPKYVEVLATFIWFKRV